MTTNQIQLSAVVLITIALLIIIYLIPITNKWARDWIRDGKLPWKQ